MQNNTKHIVRLAQQQALSSFSELVGQMLADTDARVGGALRNAAAADQAPLQVARNWLSNSDRAFRRTILEKYTVLLERAMETMHTDLRAGLNDIRADNLSLIDDDVMTRQIELDRLAARLRDVDEMSLGRINLTIANLHGVSKVRERENPFRPYLAARALYESVRETVRDAGVSSVLFGHLSSAMASHLPGYYAAILAHFEARGLDARLLAQPADMTRAQSERMNAHYGNGGSNQVQGLQELVWQVLDERPPVPGATPAPARSQGPQRFWLDAQIRQLQQAQAGTDGDGALSPLALSEQVGEKADPLDRMTIDLVGLVFDYIQREERLPKEMRALIGRLHLPFLRAAVLDPDLLQSPGHPARSLLDRLGTLAAGVLAGTSAFPELRTEAGRLVNRLRDTFDSDVLMFRAAEQELDAVVAAMLQRATPMYGQLRDAVATGDAQGAQLAAMQATLKPLLAPLNLDPRLAAFIDTVWIHVMLCQAGVVDTGLLAELIWSAQEKATPADRGALMRALPTLVRRIRAGIALLGLAAAESQAALDQLVAVHMDVLGQRIAPGGPSMSLDWLRVRFGQLGDTVTPAPAMTEPMPPAAIAALLASQGVRVQVHGAPTFRDPRPLDAQWLARARPGASFARQTDDGLVFMLLEAVSADQATFVFSTPAPAVPQVYRQHALLAAMHDGTVRPVEYAPLFERAVSSAMARLASPTTA